MASCQELLVATSSITSPAPDHGYGSSLDTSTFGGRAPVRELLSSCEYLFWTLRRLVWFEPSPEEFGSSLQMLLICEAIFIGHWREHLSRELR
jgi:hypothetical protein